MFLVSIENDCITIYKVKKKFLGWSATDGAIFIILKCFNNIALFFSSVECLMCF